MQKRIIKAGLVGMNQDVINPEVNSRQAYEVKNFRINATANSNAIELTSEKSTKQMILKGVDGISLFQISSSTYTIIGSCSINDNLVVFVCGKNANPDMILNFKLVYDSSQGVDQEVLRLQENGSFKGDLNFSTMNPIECVPCYENDDIAKVYWIDGKNYPRVINIMNDYGWPDVQTSDPFSFYQEIGSGSYQSRMSVSKTHIGGLFYAGVVQYAMSFYNRNAQETPIVYTTPLNYISHSDRGEEPNRQLGCAFDIQFMIGDDAKERFDYIRFYSIYRSSANGTPVVKVIKDVKCDQLTQFGNVWIGNFTDTNEQGYDFDAYRIIVNSDHIKPNAIATKDGKMFLANYESDIKVVNEHIISPSGSVIQWVTGSEKQVDYDESSSYKYLLQIDENDSQTIKGFKLNEYYKFGLQFQDKYGNWSNPFVIDENASKNTQAPTFASGKVRFPYAEMTQTIQWVKQQLGNTISDYVKVRPVVSFPTISERNVLCQGIVNPTVFNVTQRTNGTCYAQSSWFFRPFFASQEFSGSAYDPFDTNKGSYMSDSTQDGAHVRSVHFRPLFPSNNIGGELQNMYFDGTGGYRNYVSFFDMDANQLSEAATKYHDYYYVDQSILTLNSPDIDFDDNLRNVDISQYKIKLVGYVPFTYNYGKQLIIAESPLFYKNQEYDKRHDVSYYDQSAKMCVGFVDKPWNSHHGRFVSRLSWLDDINGVFKFELGSYRPAIYSNFYVPGNKWNKEGYSYMYCTYPFQRDYLNNYAKGEHKYTRSNGDITIEDIDSSKILKKVLSNLKYSNKTYYENVQASGIVNGIINTGDIKLYDSNENEFIKVGGKIYYGNVDQLLTTTSPYKDYVFNGNIEQWLDSDSYAGEYSGSGSGSCTKNIVAYCFDDTEVNGYPIITGGVPIQPSNSYHIDDSEYKKLSRSYKTYKYDQVGGDEEMGWESPATESDGDKMSIFVLTPNMSSSDPILMRYKSGRHIVFNMKLDGTTQYLFPQVQVQVQSGGGTATYYSWNNASNKKVPWDQQQKNYNAQARIDFTNTGFGYASGNEFNEFLFLCDVCREQPNQSYNNNTDDFSNQNRTWLPCGDIYDLENDASEYIAFKEGDTFFQRYDCLKTYPFSEEDTQSIVEIASFMCETHINLDGRYDRNRGLRDNTFINQSNFNLINPVYSQQNNFFNYHILDENAFRTTKFPTRFTWSLNKVNGQDIDEWTRTNTAAFHDCEGDKGEITSLRRFNRQIYAFQEKGISRIKYNENVAINVQNGLPIELGNSASVNGVEYLSEFVGSQNKWSTVSTPNGIFFVDVNTPGIYRLGGGQQVLTNLTKNCMQRWFENISANGRFTRSSYDGNTNEVLFEYTGNNLADTIAFNCDYNAFTSLYDYSGVIGNIGTHSYNIVENDIHMLREGSGYNSFYGTLSPYWISFVANSNIDGYNPANAIYDNVWYNADVVSYSTSDGGLNRHEQIQDRNLQDSKWNETFNDIQAANDYQYGIFNSKSVQTRGFEFIKKFRTWRVPVPRNQRFNAVNNVHRDRMRGQWLRIKLSNMNPSTDKMILRDICVDSFY